MKQNRGKEIITGRMLPWSTENHRLWLWSCSNCLQQNKHRLAPIHSPTQGYINAHSVPCPPSFFFHERKDSISPVPRKGTLTHFPEWPSERLGSEHTLSGFLQFTHTGSYRMWRWFCSLLPGLKSDSSSLLFLANAASFSEIFHADNG